MHQLIPLVLAIVTLPGMLTACGDADATPGMAAPPGTHTPTETPTAVPPPSATHGYALQVMPPTGSSPPKNTAIATADPEVERLVNRPISFEEAQRIVTLDLVMPDSVPDSMQFDDVYVSESSSLTGAFLRFSLRDGVDPYVGIHLLETLVPHSPDPGDLRRSAMLGEIEVTKVTNDSSWCWFYRAYEWHQSGVYFKASTHLTGDMTDAMLLDLVAATMGIDPAVAHGSALAIVTPEEEHFGQPTEEGRYCGIGLDQASDLVNFEVVVPDPLPSQLVFDHLYVESTAPSGATDPKAVTAIPRELRLPEPNLVVMLFRDTKAAEHWTFVVLEQGTTDRGIGALLQQRLKDGSVVNIGGVEVVKRVDAINTAPGQPQVELLNYFWQTGEISFRLEATTEAANRPVFDNMLEEMIATLIGE